MLFDLQGKRKRFIQIVFGLLAAVFAISFVGFGIGSGVSGGGIFDAIGVGGGGHGGGGGGTSPNNPQFERDIEAAEARLVTNPEDEAALIEIARVRYLAGQEQLELDDQGNVVVSDDAASQFEGSVAAWSDYVALAPAEVDTNVARLVVESYVSLNDAGGAAEVQRVIVAAAPEPDSRALSELARFLYLDSQMKEGDKIAKEAIAAADENERQQVRQQLTAIADQVREFERQQASAEESESTEPNPLETPATGGVGGQHDGN
ncbi:MAG: hypothetical protein ACR2N5_01695 [Solirubrobacterales bacterium]